MTSDTLELHASFRANVVLSQHKWGKRLHNLAAVKLASAANFRFSVALCWQHWLLANLHRINNLKTLKFSAQNSAAILVSHFPSTGFALGLAITAKSAVSCFGCHYLFQRGSSPKFTANCMLLYQHLLCAMISCKMLILGPYPTIMFAEQQVKVYLYCGVFISNSKKLK